MPLGPFANQQFSEMPDVYWGGLSKAATKYVSEFSASQRIMCPLSARLKNHQGCIAITLYTWCIFFLPSWILDTYSYGQVYMCVFRVNVCKADFNKISVDAMVL